jgi:hypothetical protein
MCKYRNAVLAAVAALALAVPAAAQARSVAPAGGEAKSAATTTSSLARTVTGPRHIAPAVIKTTAVSMKPVEAGSTGDGPADDGECQGYAATINFVLEEAQDELNDYGNGSDYDMLIEYAQTQQDIAENVGCFIVNAM